MVLIRGGLCSMISTWMKTCPLFGVYVQSEIFLLINLYPFDGLLSHGDLITSTSFHACEMFCYFLFDQTIDEQISNKMNLVTSKQDEKTLRIR